MLASVCLMQGNASIASRSCSNLNPCTVYCLIYLGQGASRGRCGQNGFCRAGICRCAIAFAGNHCSDRIPLPGPLIPLAQGHFLLTRSRVATLMGGPDRETAGSRKKGASNQLSAASREAGLPFPITPSLLQALPNKDYLGSRLYDRCALVAPGDRLRGRRLHEDIDSHDLVMRFDAATTKGAFISHRTGWRVFACAGRKVLVESSRNFDGDWT